MYYGSEVKAQPDFIEGDSAMKSFSAGGYVDVGVSVQDMDITSRTLSVRPRKPFAISSQMWSGCPFRKHSPFKCCHWI